MIFIGALCFINIFFTQTFNKSFADIFSVYNIKYPHSIALSTMTNILSYFCLVTGSFDFNNLTIKSHDIISHNLFGISTGYNFPYSLCLTDLFLWQSKYLFIISFAIFQILCTIYFSQSFATSLAVFINFCIKFP